MLGNEHYQITPATSYVSLPLTLHLSRRRRFAKTNTGSQQKSNFKVIHKLKSAAASKAKLNSKRNRVDSKRLSDEAMKKARQQMMKDQETLNDESDDDDDSGETSSVYETRQMTKKIAKKNKKSSKNRVIELAIFTDEAFYRKWAAMYPEDTVKKINQYVLTLVNNVILIIEYQLTFSYIKTYYSLSCVMFWLDELSVPATIHGS